MGFACVTKAQEKRPQRVGVPLDRLRCLLGFARKRDRRFVSVRHHGPVCGISGLGELNEEVRRQPARL